MNAGKLGFYKGIQLFIVVLAAVELIAMNVLICLKILACFLGATTNADIIVVSQNLSS